MPAFTYSVQTGGPNMIQDRRRSTTGRRRAGGSDRVLYRVTVERTDGSRDRDRSGYACGLRGPGQDADAVPRYDDPRRYRSAWPRPVHLRRPEPGREGTRLYACCSSMRSIGDQPFRASVDPSLRTSRAVLAERGIRDDDLVDADCLEPFSTMSRQLRRRADDHATGRGRWLCLRPAVRGPATACRLVPWCDR